MTGAHPGGSQAVNPGAAFWHARYRQQARWTADLRSALLRGASLPTPARLLEVGSGTGVITSDLVGRGLGSIFGLEVDQGSNVFAARYAPQVRFVTGDALRMPFRDAAFDACLCHFVVLWMRDPERMLEEMRRVTAPGGWVACLAEPDYGGRIDYPEVLEPIGRLQAQALRRQGAQPMTGRRLLGLLTRAGLQQVTAGVLGGEWAADHDLEPNSLEWDTLRADLAGTAEETLIPQLEAADRSARADRSRILYVPTFYAHGRVPLPG